MELFLIYLWLKLDTFQGLLFFSVGIFVFTFPIVRLAIRDFTDDDEKGYSKTHRRFILPMCIALLVGVLMPSSKDMAILVGSSYAIDLAKSPEGVKISTLLRNKVNEVLDEQLKEKK